MAGQVREYPVAGDAPPTGHGLTYSENKWIELFLKAFDFMGITAL